MTERKRKPVTDLTEKATMPKANPTPKPKAAPKKKAKPAPKKKPKPKPKRASAPKSSAFELSAWNRDFAEPEVIAAFARNVRAAREAAGMSQRQVAKVINYSRVALVNMEGGKNGCTLPTMLRLCTVYGCTPNDLLKA